MKAIKCLCGYEAYYRYASDVKLLELVCGSCYRITYLVVLDGTPVFNYDGEIPLIKAVRPEHLYETCLDAFAGIDVSILDEEVGNIP